MRWERWARLAVAAATAAMIACTWALLPREADAGGFLIPVSPGAKDLPLALPPTQGGDPAARLWSVVRRDLEMSGYFNIINPDAYVETGKGIEPGTFDFADWRILKAAALAKTRVTAQGDGLRADVYVYDVNAGSKISAKGFVGKSADYRYLGHKIADEILVALTGKHGIFGSRFAAVGTASGSKEIYLLDIDGESATKLTNNGTINLSPAWSPSGDRLAYTSFQRKNPDLYVKDMIKGPSRPLSQRPGINTGATFSPDGAKIALARSANGGDSDIFIIDASTGKDVQQLTSGGGIDVAPNWSADGSRIAFASERSGGSQIYIQNLASGQASRVTFQGGFNSDPVLSPDGGRVAFVGRDRNFDVFVVDTDGKNMVRITQDMGDNEDPSWSPDGRYLIFSSTRRGKSEIWLSTADGRHQVPLTEKSAGWFQPTWKPW